MRINMNCIKYVFVMCIYAVSINVNAQLLGSIKFDPKDLSLQQSSMDGELKLLRLTLTPSIFLSRQSFQVSDKKTGDLYGLNNKDEFGTEISLGIKVKNGFVLTDRAVRPWEHNAKFETYRNDYNPVPYMSEYSEVGENAKYDTLDISQSKMKELLSTSLYFQTSDSFLGKGLTVDFTKGTKDGWIVWVCIDNGADLNKTSQVELISYSKTIDVEETSHIDLDAPDGKEILGGIYVVPNNKSIGELEFCVSGIIVENKGKWSLCFPFVGKEKLIKPNTQPVTAQTKDGDDSLTPIDDMYGQPSKKRNEKKNKKK